MRNKVSATALEDSANQQKETSAAERDREKKKEIETWVVIDGRRVPARHLAEGA